MLLLSLVTQLGRMQQTQKGFNQHEKSVVHHFAVKRFLVVKSKLPPRSGSSLEAVEPHP